MVKEKSESSRIFDKDGYRKVCLTMTNNFIGIKIQIKYFFYFDIKICFLFQRAACICVDSEMETKVKIILPKDMWCSNFRFSDNFSAFYALFFCKSDF